MRNEEKGNISTDDMEALMAVFDVVTRARGLLIVATTIEDDGTKLRYHMYSSGEQYEGTLLKYATAMHEQRMDRLINGDIDDERDQDV